MEMHKPCDSTTATCSDVNSQSYQLTVDQVCDGVNTDTKLYFEAIFDAYSIRPNCLLITTGQDADSEGTLEVSVDSGYGYFKVTPSEVTLFSPNEIVVDKCFASIVGVQVSNPTTNGWSGYIEVSSDDKKTYSSMICTYNCDCNVINFVIMCTDGDTTMIVVDGNNDGNAAIKCLGGKTCTFKQKSQQQQELKLSYSPSASYDSCDLFVREFDRLYDFRNETLFPGFNPMRVDSTQPLTSTENSILFEDTYFFTSYTFVQNQHGVETLNPVFAALTSVPGAGGCYQIKDETTCLSSKDGRDYFLNQPCRWCCGYECTAEGGNLCEPEAWLLEQPSYIGLSINGLGDGFCSRPASIYDGSTTVFDGVCIDAFGNGYGYVSQGSNQFSGCPDFCQSLPNREFQVGYYPQATSSNGQYTCYCYYGKDTLPEYSDLNELGISAYISPNYSGIGPVSKGDGASDYTCYLTPSDQEKSARGAMQMCDKTISLFLGNSVSVGRLRQVVNELEENGPTYMPGECCLDTAATSARFGFNFDPSKMDCNNRGPWHLGISDEACENAGGKWFRSPCYALKDCIDDRPKKCPTDQSQYDNDDCDDDAFSKSFEDFAKDIEIDDATDEEECSYARQQLGFDSDYMFDVEVCEEFRERMCDPFFDDVDDATDHEIKYDPISYKPPTYPPDPPFVYQELPVKPSATTVTDDDEHTEALNALQYSQQVAWGWYQTTTLREYHSNVEKDGLCQTESSFWRSLCYIGYVLFLVFWETVRGAALTGWQVISLAYIAMEQQKVNYSKFNFEILEKDGKWTYDALNIMNVNMVDINTQLQNHLQERHFSMEVNINTYSMCSTNYLEINLIKAIEPAAIVSDLPSECQAILFPSDRRYLMEEFKLEVEWPDNGNGGHGMMTKLLTYMESMKEEIMQDKKKRTKCDKESPEERNLLGEDGDEGEADSLDLNEEASYDDILSIAEIVKERMDHITNVVDELKGSMEKLEALDLKMEAVQEMNERLENKMETKLEVTDEKLDNKFEAVDEKLKTLEKMETKLEVTDDKLDNKFEAVNEKLKTLEKKMETKLEVTDEKLDNKFEAVDEKLNKMETNLEVTDEKLDNKFEAVNKKLETLEKKMETKLEAVDQKMDEMKNMIAQLLEQMAKQIATGTNEQ